ncbi:MAG: tRNA uridine-5-carboxymethylaminomethyl(34) synthesis enzyme MnmG, partial [candidate division KSB1 bacterium]|nr:tRNA uridine-5-carboxymethylaminomethyl(34) synthesis enzyme MnmG [candidate division KSB1 bacterium]
FDDEREDGLMKEVREQLEIEIKYEGYLKRQQDQIAKFDKFENLMIPAGIDYDSIVSLSNEAREKLKRIRPLSIGQAMRIAGVSPADIAVLLINLKRQ